MKEMERIRLQKQNTPGMPSYSTIEDGSGRTFDAHHFVRYSGAYIRKSTALYMLQENTQLSNQTIFFQVRELNHKRCDMY